MKFRFDLNWFELITHIDLFIWQTSKRHETVPTSSSRKTSTSVFNKSKFSKNLINPCTNRHKASERRNERWTIGKQLNQFFMKTALSFLYSRLHSQIAKPSILCNLLKILCNTNFTSLCFAFVQLSSAQLSCNREHWNWIRVVKVASLAARRRQY